MLDKQKKRKLFQICLKLITKTNIKDIDIKLLINFSIKIIHAL